MEFHMLGAAMFAMAASAHPAGPLATCSPRPMPAAVDFIGPWEDNMVMDSLTFTATPSLQAPGRAWLVRLHRFGPRDIKVNIVKLQRETNCNRYRIERQWSAALTSGEYDQTVALIEPFVTTPDRLFSIKNSRRDGDVVALDGTTLSLRTQTLGWSVSRKVHESSVVGKSLSAIFYRIATAHVPKGELPTHDWRAPRSPPAGRGQR